MGNRSHFHIQILFKIIYFLQQKHLFGLIVNKEQSEESERSKDLVIFWSILFDANHFLDWFLLLYVLSALQRQKKTTNIPDWVDPLDIRPNGRRSVAAFQPASFLPSFVFYESLSSSPPSQSSRIGSRARLHDESRVHGAEEEYLVVQINEIESKSIPESNQVHPTAL